MTSGAPAGDWLEKSGLAGQQAKPPRAAPAAGPPPTPLSPREVRRRRREQERQAQVGAAADPSDAGEGAGGAAGTAPKRRRGGAKPGRAKAAEATTTTEPIGPPGRAREGRSAEAAPAADPAPAAAPASAPAAAAEARRAPGGTVPAAPTDGAPEGVPGAQAQAVETCLAAEDCFEILKIGTQPSAPDIRKAYLKMSVLLHPDKNSHPQAEEAFVKLTQAFKEATELAEEGGLPTAPQVAVPRAPRNIPPEMVAKIAQAEANLTVRMMTSHPGVLQRAIEQAQRDGLQGPVVQAARDRLRQLQGSKSFAYARPHDDNTLQHHYEPGTVSGPWVRSGWLAVVVVLMMMAGTAGCWIYYFKDQTDPSPATCFPAIAECEPSDACGPPSDELDCGRCVYCNNRTAVTTTDDAWVTDDIPGGSCCASCRLSVMDEPRGCMVLGRSVVAPPEDNTFIFVVAVGLSAVTGMCVLGGAASQFCLQRQVHMEGNVV
mmetsp:Transcript_40895/g.107363  ORF Transcript_40895/g.107363 Transcript_40895/m.107363 type:complete len:488 (+) Transcript_40895:34-1497(+)